MPLQRVPGRDLSYHLVVFDEDGREAADGGARYSQQVCTAAGDTERPVTDVFVMSHGWKGDVPAAIGQYDRWLTAMHDQDRDRAVCRQRHPGWRALVVGLHWPSLPWGDERLTAAPRLLSADGEAEDDWFAAEDAADPRALVEAYARRIADTPAARTALHTVLSATPGNRDGLSAPVLDAYATLFAESGLVCAGSPAAPGADQEAFSPEAIAAQAQEGGAAGGPAVLGERTGNRALDLLRMPLRQLSFWKMKDRARQFGEGGAHDFLRSLQSAAPAARFHLMGHSFGCIVASGAVAGPAEGARLPGSVDTLFLAQGALSLWAFTESVPSAPGTPGYFHRIVSNRLVRGVVATTRSTFDTAVGRFYPLGAGLARQRVLGDDLPAFGAIGSFGIQGVPSTTDVGILDDRQSYDFQPGRVTNLEASRVICHGGGPSGAHSDIAQPQVAHAFWQSVMAADEA